MCHLLKAKMPQLSSKNATISKIKCQFTFYKMPPLPGADPGFVVRGDVSRRGVWGRPQLIQGRTLVGAQGGKSPPEPMGILGITDIYLNDNFEPTTPFLSDQKSLTLSLNFVG